MKNLCFLETNLWLLLLPSLALAQNLSKDHFSPELLKKEVAEFISASRPNRTVGKKGHEKAFIFLKNRLDLLAKSSGAPVYVHVFKPEVDYAANQYEKDFETLVGGRLSPDLPEYKKWKSFTQKAVAFVRAYKETPGRNLILELKGSKNPDQVLYIGAHYDSITHDRDTMEFTADGSTEGANDNASGVGAALAIANYLAGRSHPATIRIIFFDYEEIFFLGSHALAQEMKARTLPWIKSTEKYLGLINLEMIGRPIPVSKGYPVLKLYTRRPDWPNAQEDLWLANAFKVKTQESNVKLKPVLLQNGFDRSDQWSFWKSGLSAIGLSHDWEAGIDEARYHSARDTLSTLDFDYLAAVAKVTAMVAQASGAD